jgi:hypothetical protein
MKNNINNNNIRKIMNISRKQSNNINIIDPSFSVYLDKQVKNTPPTEDFLQQHINKIYPKSKKEWVDSEMVKNCQSCSSLFSIFYRKHHCRACGGVFCSTCCNKYLDIPNHLIEKPNNNNNMKTKVTNMMHWWKNGNKSLVCSECYFKIKNLIKIEHYIKILDFVDLETLFIISEVSKDWHNASIHILSKFRNIQYQASDHEYTSWESNMLWNSRKLLIGHNTWYNSLIKSTIYYYYHSSYSHKKDRIKELFEIIEKDYTQIKKADCWSLMCSRKCNLKFDIFELLDIIQYTGNLDVKFQIFWDTKCLKNIISSLTAKIMSSAQKIETQVIPLLSLAIRILVNSNYEVIDIKYINEIFKKIIGIEEELLILLAWESNYLSCAGLHNDRGTHNFCKIVNEYLIQNLKPEVKSIIYKTINTLMNITNKDILKKGMPILYPFNTKYMITEISHIVELKSYSKPLLIYGTIEKMDETKKQKDIKFIIKKDKG